MSATISSRIDKLEVRRLEDVDGDWSWLEGPYEDAEHERHSKARLEGYGQDWWFIGVDARAIVYINGVRQEITSGGLWGIESDSTSDYLDEIGSEQLDELKGILHALGFTDEQINAVETEEQS